MVPILTPTNKNRKPAYLQFDNLDDRREIHVLLRKLSPLQCLSFLNWFYDQVHLGPWLSLKPVASRETVQLAHDAMNDDSLAQKFYLTTNLDIWNAASSYEGLSLDLAFNRLVELVKGKS